MFVGGSIRETVPSRLFVTQTAPPPVVIPLGPAPTPIVCTTAHFSGSIRETLLPSVFVTQTAPSPTATRVGVAPTGTCPVISPVAESTRPSAFASTLARASEPLEPPPSAKIGIATAAAITPASAASNSARRRSGCGGGAFAARSGGNSLGRPSTTSSNRCSGRSTSFSR